MKGEKTMEKKRIEFEKKELIFLLNILEELADSLYEDEFKDKKEIRVKLGLIDSIYLKIIKSLGETLPDDLRKYLYYDHKDYTSSGIYEALEELNKKGKI